MTIEVVHDFVSGKSDGGDATVVKPSDWNADHILETTESGIVLGRDTSGAGALQELPLAFDADGNPDFTEAVGGLGLPTGTTAERLSGARDGTIRCNSDTNAIEAMLGSSWIALLTAAYTATITMIGAAFNEAVRVDVASSATTNIGSAASNSVRITGTTTITALGSIASGARRHVVFNGALILTHNATSLILPTGANITTAAGDTATFISEGSGKWRCHNYQRASGAALDSSTLSSSSAILASDVALTNIASYFTGPTIANPGTGTYLVTGRVTVYDSSSGSTDIWARLTDGTTIIASGVIPTNPAGSSQSASLTLTGVITNPAGALKVEVRDATTVNGVIEANASGNSKDSGITWVRIA